MTQAPIKPYTILELAGLYSVSRKVFNSWIDYFCPKLGELTGKIYTILQVELIFERLGHPTNTSIKYTTLELAGLYKVSKKVFGSWLKLFRTKVGKLVGKTYTILQAQIIFEHLGQPKNTGCSKK